MIKPIYITVSEVISLATQEYVRGGWLVIEQYTSEQISAMICSGLDTRQAWLNFFDKEQEAFVTGEYY